MESFSYADGEIVGVVHASCRERDGTYETCAVFEYPYYPYLLALVEYVGRSNSALIYVSRKDPDDVLKTVKSRSVDR